jgi:hypothetical protein
MDWLTTYGLSYVAWLITNGLLTKVAWLTTNGLRYAFAIDGVPSIPNLLSSGKCRQAAVQDADCCWETILNSTIRSLTFTEHAISTEYTISTEV